MTASPPYTINSLMAAFRKALRAVVPVAEEIGIPWREPDAYDDWDAVANGLYEGFLLHGIRESKEYNNTLPLAPYGVRRDDYTSYGYVAASWRGQVYPLVELATVAAAFDTCVLARCENGKFKEFLKAPFSDCNFLLAAAGNVVTESLSW